VENVTDGIVTADEQGRIESLNRAALALFGYPEEEVIGQPLELVLAPVLSRCVLRSGRRELGTGRRRRRRRADH
jgi:PAS domain S-box-containing protein